MAGKVYPNGPKSWKVHFRGTWFTRDEHGRVFRAEFYALSFLNLLNALYDPDPAKNRYDPSRFKDKTPYHFDEAFELYLDRKEAESAWQKNKKWIYQKHLEPFFGKQDFRTIDELQLNGLAKSLEKKGLKGKTIQNILMVLHAFLKYFRAAPDFPPVRYQKPKIKWYTDQEIDQVFEFINEEDRGYFLFIRYYGVRPEEASGLLKSAINWQTKEITISTVYVDGRIKQRTKTQTERTLPIIPEIEQYLKRGDRGQGAGDSQTLHPTPITLYPFFVFDVNGHPYTRHVRERRWNEAMKQAVQKYSTRAMTLRDLRHSAATRWRRAGTRIEDIQKLLGHSDSRVTTEFYADVATHDLIPIVRGK